MKTCKKILAGVLVLAMMLSMCAFTVSADEVASTGITLYKVSFDSASVGATSTWPHDEYVTIGGKGAQSQFAFRKVNFGSNAVTSGTIVNKSEGDNYLSHTSSWSGANFRQTPNDIAAKFPDADCSVIKLSYDIMIPADTEYKENLRAGSFPLGATSATSSSGMCTVAPKIHDGKAFVGVSGIGTEKLSEKIDYTYGEWLTFDIITWIDTATSKLVVAVYANDDLIYYGLSSSNAAGLAASDLNFSYANTPDGETRVSGDSTYVWKNGILTGIKGTDGTVNTDVPETIVSTTCYDNISLELLPASAKISDAEIEAIITAKKAAAPYVRLFDLTCDKLASTVGTSGKAVFTNTGKYSGYDMAQGSATDEHKKEAYAVSEDGTYTNVTYSSYKYLIANYRNSFSEYVQKGNGDTSVFVYENNLNLKDFNAPVGGTIGIALDLNGDDITAADGTTIPKRTSSDISISYDISTDGSFEFSDGIAGTGKRVSGAKRSEARTVTAGEWINIKEVFEITHNEAQYDIKVYGIYNNAVIYENEFTLTYKDYDKDGVSDDLHINAFNLKLGTDNTAHTETVTGIDNIYFEKNNNFDWSVINTDAWINRTVKLDLDESGNVDVLAKKGEGTFESGILVVALYNANGKVVDILTSTAITDGKFVYEVPAAELAGAKTVKGFVFDDITTAVPLMPHGAIVLE